MEEVRRRYRRHSVEFKAEVMAACQPGVSVASVALAHGLNANLVRLWLSQQRKALARPETLPKDDAPAFVPVKLEERTQPQPQDIRIELRRSATTITVTWPASAGAECAAWMRELLR